jgi:hypothetical protein
VQLLLLLLLAMMLLPRRALCLAALEHLGEEAQVSSVLQPVQWTANVMRNFQQSAACRRRLHAPGDTVGYLAVTAAT